MREDACVCVRMRAYACVCVRRDSQGGTCVNRPGLPGDQNGMWSSAGTVAGSVVADSTGCHRNPYRVHPY
jgi:hypothetical protein